jgi:hypothetical protein
MTEKILPGHIPVSGRSNQPSHRYLPGHEVVIVT